MSELTDFLLARIAEDEAVAREATEGPWVAAGVWYRSGHDGETEVTDAHPLVGGGPLGSYVVAESWREGRQDTVHIARHDPARVLAECEAKRAIVHLLGTGDTLSARRDDYSVTVDARGLLGLLASTYADHPDYDERWRP